MATVDFQHSPEPKSHQAMAQNSSRIQALSNTPPILSKMPAYVYTYIIDIWVSEKANKDFQATISNKLILLYPCCGSFSFYRCNSKAALANPISVV